MLRKNQEEALHLRIDYLLDHCWWKIDIYIYVLHIIHPYHAASWWNSHLVGNIHLDTIVRQFSGYSVIVCRGNMCEDLELFIHIVHIFSVIVGIPWSKPNVSQQASCLSDYPYIGLYFWVFFGRTVTLHLIDICGTMILPSSDRIAAILESV